MAVLVGLARHLVGCNLALDKFDFFEVNNYYDDYKMEIGQFQVCPE